MEARFGVQSVTELVKVWLMKSRGSTGKSLPPIWKVSVWDVVQGN